MGITYSGPGGFGKPAVKTLLILVQLVEDIVSFSLADDLSVSRWLCWPAIGKGADMV